MSGNVHVCNDGDNTVRPDHMDRRAIFPNNKPCSVAQVNTTGRDRKISGVGKLHRSACGGLEQNGCMTNAKTIDSFEYVRCCCAFSIYPVHAGTIQRDRARADDLACSFDPSRHGRQSLSNICVTSFGRSTEKRGNGSYIQIC